MTKIGKIISGGIGAIALLFGMAFSPHISTAVLAETAVYESHIQVSPSSDRLKLDPGQEYDGSFVVNNIGTGAFSFSVYVTPFSMNDDCSENYETGSDYTEMSKWVTFDQSEFSNVQPGTGRTINYHIDVPNDIPSNSQYIAIFAETRKDSPDSDATINISQRVGYKVYVDLGGETRESGEVKSAQQSGFFFTPPVNSIFRVQNTGNIDFVSDHQMIVKDLFGKEIHNSSTSATVLPNSCREVELKYDAPAFGIFNVTNKVGFLNGTQYDETKLVVVMPIYLLAIFGLVIILLIYAVILKLRKKK